MNSRVVRNGMATAAVYWPVVCVFASADVAAQQPVPVSPTMIEIARAVEATWKNVSSLHVCYRLRADYRDRAGRVVIGGYSPEEFAMKGSRQFRRRGAWISQRGKASEWQELSIWFDGERTIELSAISVSGKSELQPVSIVAGRADAKINCNNYYMDAIGAPHYEGEFSLPWWIQRSDAGPVKFRLLEALTEGQYSAAAEPVRLGDRRCLVFSNETDRVWLARDLGWAIVRREWNWSGTSSLAFHIDNRQFKKAASGLWLPEVSAVMYYAHPKNDDTESNGHWKRRFVAKVSTIQVNNVADVQFEPQLPAGIAVLDASRAERTATGTPVVSYTIGKTVDDTERELQMALTRTQTERRGLDWSIVLKGLSIAVFILLCLTIVWQRWNQRLRNG